MKKLLSLLLVGIIVPTLVLSACGTTESTGSTTAPAATSASGSSDSQVSGQLSFLSWYDQTTYQPILDGFKAKYPDVEIDFQNVPNENQQYVQRLQLLASSGELPDLFYLGPPVTLMAKNGYLSDISELDAVKALPDGYKQSMSYDGKVYVYAPDAWIGGVFYNKALFAQYNLSEPKTWSDFLAAAKVFHENGIKPISMSAGELPDLVNWIHITEVVSQDPAFDTKINTGETTFTEGYLQALQTWKTEMVDTGYISQDMVGLSDEQRFDEFATGKAAMTISGPWAVNTFREKNPDLEFSIFPFPGSTEDRTYTVGSVNVGLAISSNAKNRAAAEAFINYLATDEGLTNYQKITGNFMASDSITYEIDPVMEPIRAYAENGRFAYPPVNWTYTTTLTPMLEKGMQEIVLGSKTPEELVKELDEKQAELMAN